MREVVKPKRKPGRPRKNVEEQKNQLDPAIQHGMFPRFHAPCSVCTKCGLKGVEVKNESYHELHALERYYTCPGDHTWVEVREMGTP